MKTYMFPGQGSQSKGMGASLFDKFADLTEKADQILGYSIKALCLCDERNELNNTQFTQPALYVVNALSYFDKLQNDHTEPDYAIGHSLGEFNALLAAGCYDFDTGLQLVKKRGELMSQAPQGAMAAILNASKSEIESILEFHGLNNVDLANYNTPSQIVISGAQAEIIQAQQHFEDAGAIYYPLNTSGAFHSRFMQPASELFFDYLQGFTFSQPRFPVISNVTARPYESEDIVKNLCEQLKSCVYWSDGIEYLLNLNRDNGIPMDFEEIGHGEVLTKLLRTIKNKVPITEKSTSTESDPNKSNAATNTLIIDWNNQHPIGTKVNSIHAQFQQLETRSPAKALSENNAVVYMKGYYGYFSLDELIFE
ncbi:ACP S-malonyltransferase [Teredinibacter haidensis]|uniref:ACP S-malonyltransferase n=1 Tax=Teredinibacter haidensis TaxID=2731755 RepID=UPI000948A24F|nr:ACP S-malonyltransferase [Teredinibacter haidensis]